MARVKTWVEQQMEKDPVGFAEERLLVEATEAIAVAMRKRRITNAAHARRLGTSERYVRTFLRDGDIRLRTLARIAWALGTRVEFTLAPRRLPRRQLPASGIHRRRSARLRPSADRVGQRNRGTR